MKKTIALALKEWRGFFHTPFAMIIVPVYLVLTGTYFYVHLDQYLNLAQPNQTLQKVMGLSVMNHLLVPFLKDLLNVFVFIVPLITMRSFAEEKKLGTYDLLISYPLRPQEILLGKYVGATSLVLSLLALSVVFPGLVAWKGEPYLPQIASTYLGLVLFLLLYVAVGVVASLLTENQIVAAILTYATFFSTILFQWMAYVSVAPWDRFFANFLFVPHLESFRSGLIFTGDFAVFICSTAIILLGGYSRLRRHYIR